MSSFKEAFDLQSLFYPATAPHSSTVGYRLARIVLVLALTPLSWVYTCLQQLRSLAYRLKWLSPQTLAEPVISVGNVTVGGTGKTPTVVQIARKLASLGQQTAILTRGYPLPLANQEWCVLVNGRLLHQNTRDSLSSLPDEAVQLSSLLPNIAVVLGPHRSRNAERFKSWLQKTQDLAHLCPQIWILDDGFQHRQLHRDLDIVLCDHRSPFGNGKLLPAGPLREPATSLGRADVVLRSHAYLPSQSATKDPSSSSSATSSLDPSVYARLQAAETLETRFIGPLSLASYRRHVATPHPTDQDFSPELLPEKGPVHLASNIARPERFLKQLKDQMGFQIEHCLFGRDHARFDWQRLDQVLKHSPKPLIITEKDYWRHAKELEEHSLLKVSCFVFVMVLQLPSSLEQSLEQLTRNTNEHSQKSEHKDATT